MRKVLIAIDGTDNALRAVDYVGWQFSVVIDLRVTLFHVSPGIAPELWDDGHILTDEERTERKRVLDKWLANQKQKIESIFQPAIERLTRAGITLIETKAVSESVANVPECILAEAKTGGYQTLVMGRCGHSRAAHVLMGSTVSRVMNRGAGIAVCMVE